MKSGFKILVETETEGSWWEEYPDKKVDSLTEATTIAQDVIDWFNQTLRPGELPRHLVRVELFGDETRREHSWVKTSLMTKSDGLRLWDEMKCSHCGLTGRRQTLGGGVRPDKLFGKPLSFVLSRTCEQMKEFFDTHEVVEDRMGVRRWRLVQQRKKEDSV